MFALLLTISAVTQTSADQVRAAAADVLTLPPEQRATTRYLSLHALADDDRAAGFAVTSYVLNAVSQSRAIARPQRVGQADGVLIRVNVADYAPSAASLKAWLDAWEQIAAADPYFHLRTNVLDPKSGKTRIVTVPGGWTDLNAAAQLQAATGSAGAVLRADHFIVQATTPPAYYRMAGVPDTEAEFLKSLGVDNARIEKLRANAGANLLISGVTQKPRRVIWQPGPLGGVYATLDMQQVSADRDPLRRPISVGKLQLQFDASEWFAMRANGLWTTALFNRQGKRQDVVPDKVAKDTSDARGDGIVIPAISCIRCHREGGLRPFADDQQKLLRGKIELYGLSPDVVRRAAEFYDEPRLQRQMAFDRDNYTLAVSRAADMQPAEMADALAAEFRRFAYLPVSSAQAAREVGLSADDFRTAVKASRDPILLLLGEDQPVLRGQWESSLAEAEILASGSAARKPESKGRSQIEK